MLSDYILLYWSNSWQVFCNIGKLQDPSDLHLILVVIAAEWSGWNVHHVSPALFWQCVHSFKVIWFRNQKNYILRSSIVQWLVLYIVRYSCYSWFLPLNMILSPLMGSGLSEPCTLGSSLFPRAFSTGGSQVHHHTIFALLCLWRPTHSCIVVNKAVGGIPLKCMVNSTVWLRPGQRSELCCSCCSSGIQQFLELLGRG